MTARTSRAKGSLAWLRQLWGVLALLGASCHSGNVRYAFAPAVTHRIALSEQAATTREPQALLLIAPNVWITRCHRNFELGFTYRPSHDCSSIKGPVQVLVPCKWRGVTVSSRNEFNEVTSKYEMKYDFEPGHIYEIWFEDQDAVIDWQLYAVSDEQFARLHASAPKELREIPH